MLNSKEVPHAFIVGVPEPRDTEKGLYHMHETLAGCDLYPYSRVAVARIPPVVPYARLDDCRLALMQNAGLPVAFYGQLTLERGEALDLSGMAVFPHDTRADERGQLRGPAACRVVPGKLQDCGAFPGDGVLPDLAQLYRCAIRRAVLFGGATCERFYKNLRWFGLS